MCEIRVVMIQDGNEEVLMENVTQLEVKEEAIAITSLFEGVKEIEHSTLQKIDFLAGKVFLARQV